jgi:aspartyl-tRNA(Asn)/glutamyl-tRNA(Gln) amidotransferase subunit A
MNDPCLLPAYALAREIAAQRLSSTEAVDAHLERITRLDSRLHAWIDLYEKEAREAAAAADKAIRANKAAGPLHGVPIAIKDIIDIETHVTTCGSTTRRDRIATTTATVVRRALAQGMVVLGKTHTVEFACGAWGTNQHLGTPWNPWDTKVARTPGGSSSGSGVAVAARMTPWALGTDTGGSVRQPAAWCGITGLKTTIGRISTHGIHPLSPTLDTPGTMARTVIDVALLYDALQGEDPLDPLTGRHGIDDPLLMLNDGVTGLRLARLPAPDRDGIDAEILEAYDRSLERLAVLGAKIVDIELPFRLADFVNVNLSMAEGYFVNKAAIDDPQAKIDEIVRMRLTNGSRIMAHEYYASLVKREEQKRRFVDAMKGIDAFLTPSTETPPIPVDAIDPAVVPVRFARFVNILDLCGLAVPNGFTRGRLPTSLQVVCRGYEEAMALRIGQAYQRNTDWHERMPPAAA